jgi:hypothetical protein
MYFLLLHVSAELRHLQGVCTPIYTILYSRGFQISMYRLPEYGGVPPEHVAVNKTLYYCVLDVHMLFL